MPAKSDLHDSSAGSLSAASSAAMAESDRSAAAAGAAPSSAGELASGGPESFTRFQAVGWVGQLGLEIVRASAGEVLAEWTVAERHLQPLGIVHGGVYATVVETCCSVGAVLAAPAGKRIVGVENHTSFVRAVRGGRLRARARPLHAGRQAQLWECSIVDEGERLIATGRLRVFCVDEATGTQP